MYGHHQVQKRNKEPRRARYAYLLFILFQIILGYTSCLDTLGSLGSLGLGPRCPLHCTMTTSWWHSSAERSLLDTFGSYVCAPKNVWQHTHTPTHTHLLPSALQTATATGEQQFGHAIWHSLIIKYATNPKQKVTSLSSMAFGLHLALWLTNQAEIIWAWSNIHLMKKQVDTFNSQGLGSISLIFHMVGIWLSLKTLSRMASCTHKIFPLTCFTFPVPCLITSCLPEEESMHIICSASQLASTLALLDSWSSGAMSCCLVVGLVLGLAGTAWKASGVGGTSTCDPIAAEEGPEETIACGAISTGVSDCCSPSSTSPSKIPIGLEIALVLDHHQVVHQPLALWGLPQAVVLCHAPSSQSVQCPHGLPPNAFVSLLQHPRQRMHSVPLFQQEQKNLLVNAPDWARVGTMRPPKLVLYSHDQYLKFM